MARAAHDPVVMWLVLAGLAGCTFEPTAPNPDAPCQDADRDGVCNEADGCSDNASKSAPGVCGCSLPDTDLDGDGVTDCLGCSDGQREGFLSVGEYPNIAACSGGWEMPGVIGTPSACDHHAGDDSSSLDGAGCSSRDLCQRSWRICSSTSDVAASSPDGCDDSVFDDLAQPRFFATGQSGPGNASCGPFGSDDLFGCGSIGTVPAGSCAPLTRSSNNLCSGLSAPWDCGLNSNDEARRVVKRGPAGGGVLCCRTP